MYMNIIKKNFISIEHFQNALSTSKTGIFIFQKFQIEDQYIPLSCYL